MTKERLQNYRHLRMEVIQLQDNLRQLRLDLSAPKVQAITGVPSPGSGSGRPLEGAVAKLVELEEIYEVRLNALLTEKIAVEQAIAGLASPRDRTLMRARYLDGLSWEEVCVVIGYSWQQTHRIHAAALRELADK